MNTSNCVWLSMALAVITAGTASGQREPKRFSIVAVGTADGQSRVVTMEGVRTRTWADYALWSNNNRDLYFKHGEVFDGKVHANTRLWFAGDPLFMDAVTSAQPNFGGSTNDVTFMRGLHLNVPARSMADVDLDELENVAGLVLEGETSITFENDELVITNERAGWPGNVNTLSIPEEGVIYIKTSTTESSHTRPADVAIEGTLEGRLTIVAERDININGHLLYATDPKTDPASEDALGLISGRNIVVNPAAPNNLTIYAHMMATGNFDPSSATIGSFGVEDFSSGSPRGVLAVHGGIVQNYRGAVGTFNPWTGNMVSGFDKNYTYDHRFREDPPPWYPPLDSRMEMGTWRDR